MSSTRTVTLVGVDGTRHVLACSAEPYQLRPNAQLWGTAPYAINSRQVGQIPGERVESVRALARTVVVPVQVEGATELEIDANLGALGAILSPVDDVRLIYRRPDGTERELTARYAGGGDAVQAAGESGFLQRHVTVPLIFKAHWPYWRPLSGSVEVVGPTVFDDGSLAGSNLITVTNSGDVECSPEFVITGHAEGIEGVNLTTGKGFRVRRVLEVGDTLRIDTDKRTFGVYVNDVAELVAMDPTSEYWSLVPGPNVLWWRGNTASGGEPIGGFTIRWREQYETP
jgi:hypothetical protein